MINIKRTVGAVALVASVGACSSESGGPEEAAASGHAVEVKEVAVATLGDARVAFLQVVGEADITIEEQASIYAVTTPMQQLWGRGLTTLELFQALAPEQTAPEELVAAHAREAQLLRRDETIRHVSLDMAPLVEKSVTPAQCSVMFNNPYNSNYQPWVNQASYDNKTGGFTVCGGSSCQNSYNYPDEVILLGICNSDSTRVLPYRIHYKASTDFSYSYFDRTAQVNSINAQYRIQTFDHQDKIEARPVESDLVYHVRKGTGFHL